MVVAVRRPLSLEASLLWDREARDESPSAEGGLVVREASARVWRRVPLDQVSQAGREEGGFVL